MNEKTPNLQTQAAMKEARAMAIKRVPELAESTLAQSTTYARRFTVNQGR